LKPDAVTRSRSGVALVRDALRGAPIDHTTAPIGRSVVMLAIPMVMEMIMESIFAVADIFWVAHLGACHRGRRLTESMMIIVYSVAMGRLDWRHGTRCASNR